jgi:hypothetical protein
MRFSRHPVRPSPRVENRFLAILGVVFTRSSCAKNRSLANHLEIRAELGNFFFDE